MIALTADFETQLNVFRATTGATAVEMEHVSAAAQTLGKDITLPAVSAGDAAVAMTELAKAGLSVQDSISGARGVLQLATAAQLDNATATNIAASALNAFGLDGSQAVHVADLLANAANEAQGSIGDMGASLTQVASVSRQVGISLDDTVALLTLLAKNGIQGSQAGTVLRVALLRLVAPSSAAADIIQKLGLRIRDAQGNIRPQVFADFAAATEKLSAKQRDAYAAIVFGTRGIRAQAILGREGAVALNEMATAVAKQGTAEELAGARTAGFSGKVEALKNNLEGLGLLLGQKTIPLLGDLVQGFTLIVTKATDAADAVNRFNRSLPGAGGLSLGPFSSLADVIKEAHANIILLQRGDLANFGESSRAALARLNAELDKTRADTPTVAQGLSEVLRGSDSQKAVVQIRALEKSLVDTGPETDKFRERLKAVERGIIALGHVPSEVQLRLLLETGSIPNQVDDVRSRVSALPPLEVKAGFAKDSILFGDRAKVAAQASAKRVAELFSTFFGNFLPPALQAIVNPDMFDFSDQASQGGKKTGDAFARAFHQADVLTMQQEQIQAGVLPGGRAAEEANLAQQIANQLRIINTAKVGSKAYRTALKEKKRLQDELDALQAQDAADAKQRASEAKAAADAAAKAQADATQAFIDSLFPKQEALLQKRLLHAANTADLGDDIRINQGFVRIYTARIKAIRDRMRRMHLHGQALKIARDAIKSLQEQIDRLNEDIAKATTDAAAQARSAQQQHLEAMLAIAETTPGTADDRRRLLDIIAFDTARINVLKAKRKKTREEKAELDALLVDRAQRNQALRELTDETKKSKSDIQKLHEAEFAFLQTQQGFTASLIGNLIPGGLTSGLVGGTASATATAAAGPRQVAGGFEQPRGPMASAVGPRPVSQGQGNTQIALLREIRNLLRKLNMGIEHPEAKNQRSTGAAAMDYSRSDMAMGIG